MSDHAIYKVHFFDSNPTAAEDEINAALPEPDQYPPPSPAPKFYYDEDPTVGDSTYEAAVFDAGSLIRCSRQAHPGLEDAQAFFSAKRTELEWRFERPIYRTGRFWVKQVYFGGNHAEYGRSD